MAQLRKGARVRSGRSGRGRVSLSWGVSNSRVYPLRVWAHRYPPEDFYSRGLWWGISFGFFALSFKVAR